ncbi:three-Cys-motif partner protein TcmP [Thermomonospora catenispora]|uniref:three-Cys-motif partner protein TcmP n=1 Tax=Thermomonospora catenispora TaxID=2493090 RepID=UPI0013763B22|nr:three-Cys-motif partner protein TcmP [Thermomonospora catenispora]
MSTGTSGGLLDNHDQHAQSVFKHEILRQYIKRFISMLGKTSKGNQVAILDGFAGRGRYPDGREGSAEFILKAAFDLAATRRVTSFFVEKNPEHFRSLQRVVREYTARGLDAHALHGSVQDHLNMVVRAADQIPLFLFLDPCGAVLPFEQLVAVLSGPRRHERPQTELLLNFSADLSRRVAGALEKGHTGQRVMDQTCGGTWWRDLAIEVRRSSTTQSFQEVADAIVTEYARRLAEATGMYSALAPVRKRLHHQPIYHMVFFTRSPYGLWVFGDAIGKAKVKWLQHLGRLEDDPVTDNVLFPLEEAFKSIIRNQERQAQKIVTENIKRLLQELGSFKVVTKTAEIFGDAYGTATESTVYRVLRELKKNNELAVIKDAPRLREQVIGLPY